VIKLLHVGSFKFGLNLLLVPTFCPIVKNSSYILFTVKKSYNLKVRKTQEGGIELCCLFLKSRCFWHWTSPFCSNTIFPLVLLVVLAVNSQWFTLILTPTHRAKFVTDSDTVREVEGGADLMLRVDSPILSPK
jgi:hypothetical protein